MYAIQNDSVLLNGRLYAGSRGWTIPNDESDADDVALLVVPDPPPQAVKPKVKALAIASITTILLIRYPFLVSHT